MAISYINMRSCIARNKQLAPQFKQWKKWDDAKPYACTKSKPSLTNLHIIMNVTLQNSQFERSSTNFYNAHNV